MSWATRLIPACQGVADALTAAGVPATLNRTSLQVPGAWVRPDTVARFTLRGGTARLSVLLVVPQAGDLEALEDLMGVLEKALTVIEPDDDVDTSVVLPHNGNALPAFRLVVDVNLEEE
jgi:hypothetical protein